MDDKAIVLIIGAGGSVPFGFPTGEKLKWAICDGLADVDKVKTAQTKNHLAEALLKEDFNFEELVKLRDRLKTSGWESVDEFLAQHSILQTVGKAAIAACMIPCENRDQLFDPRDINGVRINNWYQLLFRTVFTPFQNITQKKISIFTYNYECSLETYLRETMSNSYEHPEEDIEAALRHIPIIHLHGEFDNHDYGSDPTSVNLRKCSEKIKIVTDNLDKSPQFQQASNDLWEAEEIYFIGFGYDEKNLARLPIKSKYPPYSTGKLLDEKRPSLNLFGSAYKVGPGVIRRVKDYFQHEGFGIHLGNTSQDAYQFLRTTLQFGS